SGAGTSRFLWDAGTDAISWRRRSAGRRIELVLWRATADAGAAWSGAAGPLETESRAVSRGGRAVFGVPLAAGWIRWGAGFERHDVGYATPDDDPGTGSTTGASEISLFGEWHRIFADRLGVTGGLRSSLDGDAEPELEPRLSLSWMPSPRAQVGIGYSRSRQIVHSLRNEESVLDVAVPTDFLGRVDGDGGPRAKADQVNLSLRMRVSPGAEVRAGAYARRMSGLVLVAPLTAEPLAVSGFARGSGRAVGLQGSASLTGGDWQGYAAYHLGHSTRTADGAAYRPLFHRTHWGLVGVSRRVSRHLTMRARTRVGSGTPSSPVSPGFSWEASDPVLGEGDLAGIPLRVGDGLNETTLPPYARVDLGVRGAWALSVLERAGEIAAFVTVENLFGRRNLLTYRLDPEVGALRPVALRPLGLNAGVGIAF
ncbi:MAG TPA: TonB-dependent receptor, partial [Longimicrobiales bacterium]|nr:TonB-dependent receptor [Longimicrobiales bacterium]